MKGKVLSIITAFLFGATMVASPIVMAAGTETGATTEEKAPEKAKTKKAKKAKKTKAKKGAKKKAAKKEKEAAPPEEK